MLIASRRVVTVPRSEIVARVAVPDPDANPLRRCVSEQNTGLISVQAVNQFIRLLPIEAIRVSSRAAARECVAMTVKRTIDHTPVPVRIWTEDVTCDAVQQLEHLARLPFVHSHVAAMPDVHVGVGSTIGSVIPTRGAIIPAAVGVDIGCGMIAAKLSIDANAGTDQNAAIHLYTHERACPEARSARGRGVSNNARARQRPWISAVSARADSRAA